MSQNLANHGASNLIPLSFSFHKEYANGITVYARVISSSITGFARATAHPMML